MATSTFPELQIPQPVDPLQQVGKVMALKSMLQQQAAQQQQMQYQQQMQPLQLQQEQQAVEQQRLQLQSQQALAKVLIQNPTGSPDDIGQQMIRNGVLPDQAFGMVKQLKEQQIQTQELRGKTLDNADKVNDAIARQSQMLLGVKDPQDRQSVYQSQTIPAMQRAGFPANMIPQQVPSDLELQAHAAAATNSNQYLKEARDQQAFEQEHGIIDPNRLRQVNDMGAKFAAVYGQSANAYQLPQGSTWDDYKRVDGMMERTEKAAQSKSQFEQGMAIRQMASGLAQLAAQEKIAQLNKPTSEEQKRYEMADNLEENLNKLIGAAQRRPDLFGNVGIKMLIAKLKGTNDPEAGALKTLSDQLGMSQASAHGMRGAEIVARATDSVVNDFKNGPQAIIGSAQAALDSVQTFKDDTDKMRAGRISGITPQMGPLGAKVQVNQQAAPKAAPMAGTLTSAQIAQAAQDHKLTYSQALQDAKSKGFTVVP